MNSTKRKFTKHPHLKSAFLCLLFFIGLFSSLPSNAKHLLVYGDSLSAAYGMAANQGWVHLLSEELSKSKDSSRNSNHLVTNASISGETSAGGLARLPLTLETLSPDIVFIALGANDGLRGYSTQTLAENLINMVNVVKNFGATPILAGISIPPSYGPRYIDSFRAVFRDVAHEQEVEFIDLFREDFLSTEGYMQADDLHPTAITQPLVRDMVKAFLIERGVLN